jgi:hypothetical protein
MSFTIGQIQAWSFKFHTPSLYNLTLSYLSIGWLPDIPLVVFSYFDDSLIYELRLESVLDSLRVLCTSRLFG